MDELWDWLVATGLIDSDTWKVYDGGEARDNCSDIDQTKWSYTASGLTYSAAVMFNYVRAFLCVLLTYFRGHCISY